VSTVEVDVNEVDDFAPGVRTALTSPEQDPTLGFQQKVFAKPFRLVFLKSETQDLTWIEVKTLQGLKNVTERIASGELIPINAWSTLDRQLWGLLAEHIGFLRYAGPDGALNAGIQPIGPEQAQLADDMTQLFGGFEPAIQAISEMRARALAGLEDLEQPTREQNEYLKGDGVNLTPEGEDILAEMVYGEQVSGNLRVKMTAANAEVLVDETEAQDPTDYAIEEIEADNRELQTKTGPEAEAEAERVERAAEGDLEDEEVDWDR
jgi:hypothetical protein